jgi:hypothetical protein
MRSNTSSRTLFVANLFLRFASLFAVLIGLILPSVLAQEPEKEGAGVIVSGQAGAKDVGLPLYPGSKPHKENTNDSQSARLGLWGAGSGFKMNVVKMESPDSPEKVAAFYKKALAKYGKVLDCSNPSPATDSEKTDASTRLSCGDDKPDNGGLLFKSGTQAKQHIVGIRPNAKGCAYQLVALAAWGGDAKR